MIDVAVTLTFQPHEYWRESYDLVQESNPLARWLLQIHPLALLGGNLLWILLFTTVILRVRFPTARVVALLIVVVHSFGVSTWLIRQPYGWLWCFGVWLLARRLFDLFWHGSGQE